MFSIVKFYTASVLTLAILLGCSDEQLATPSEIIPEPVPGFSALNGFIYSEPGQLNAIDLRRYVVGADGIKFTDVVSLQPHCDNPRLSEAGFDVYPEKGVLCDYRYTATLGSEESQAIISVFGTQAHNPLLNSLSYSIPAEQLVSNISLPLLLGVDFPVGYTLDKVERLDSGGNMRGAAVVSNSQPGAFSYTRSEGEFGWDRLRYTLSGSGRVSVDLVEVQGASSSVEHTLMGEVYILSSAASGSVAPIIGNPNASYSQPVKAGEAVVVDLATAGMQINEASQADYQLIEVQSFTATVTATVPSDVTNKRFNFQSAMPGEHFVTYIVSNHYGDYSMGLIRVHVAAVQSGKTFPDIVVSNDTPPQLSSGYTLTAPPLYEDRIANTFNVIPVFDSITNSTLAGFVSLDAAQAYCSTLGGVVPMSTTHLSTVITNAINATNATRWPVALGGYALINGASSMNWSNGLLVSCTKYSSMKWDALQTTLSVSNQFQDIGVLTKDTAAQVVSAQLISSGSIQANDIEFQMTSAPGSRKVFVKAKSSKQGSFAVKFVDNSNTTMFINSSEMTFNISKCNDYAQSLSLNCLGVEVFDSTKYFFANNITNPSKPHLVAMPASPAALTALGYTQGNTSTNSGKTYASLIDKGALFRADGQGGGQAARWCNNLSQIAFMGRRDWMMPYLEEVSPGIFNDIYIRFLNQVNINLQWNGRKTWLGTKSYKIANTLNMGVTLMNSALSENQFVFCIAPLAVESLNLNVINVGSNDAVQGKVEVTSYHSKNQPATGISVIFNVNNGALFTNGLKSITVLTGNDGKASVGIINGTNTNEVITVTANYRDVTNVDPAYKGITKTVDLTLLCKNCIDILDAGNGYLFTSSPSVFYLDNIGGSPTTGTYSDKNVDFYTFTWTNANALCTTYNTRSVGGRTNWRLPRREELYDELFTKNGAEYNARGWPINAYYWSVTPEGSLYYSVELIYGRSQLLGQSTRTYVSCVSNP